MVSFSTSGKLSEVGGVDSQEKEIMRDGNE